MAAALVTSAPVAAKARARAQRWDREGQYIAGQWRAGHSGQSFYDTDPYRRDTLVQLTLADEQDVDEAYRAAADAQRAWAEALPAERANVLLRTAALLEARHEDIVNWLVHEAGSTRVKAEVEWRMVHGITVEAASFAHRAAGRILPIDQPDKESLVYRQPVGVVGVISPWNFPMYLSQRAVAPAIAVGNAVVLKPAQDTPVSGGLFVAGLFEDAGLPPGVLNVVVGSSARIGDPFVQHPVPRLISFTGSTAVGRRVAALAAQASILKRVTLELGGNTPFVVLDDAQVEHAVPAAVFSRYLHQGQICMSANRIVVDDTVYDEFAGSFVARVRELKYGDPDDPATVIGPIINEKQLENMMARMNEARQAGARELLGGEPKGLVLPPHVFADVTNDMPIARYETFGPIAPLIRVRGEEEALRVANDTEYGLSSAVFSGDEARALRFAQGMQAGMTHVNDVTVDDHPNCPFGGEKNSGIGRFGGEWILQEMTTDHWVTVTHEPHPYPF
jgi:aldehyde dehydrogenase (NAD+)